MGTIQGSVTNQAHLHRANAVGAPAPKRPFATTAEDEWPRHYGLVGSPAPRASSHSELRRSRERQLERDLRQRQVAWSVRAGSGGLDESQSAHDSNGHVAEVVLLRTVRRAQ